MPIDIYKNDQIYNMIAEGEVANILSHYNSDYVMNLIQESIKNRFKYNIFIARPNIVYSFELNFKDLMESYPSDVENILQVRDEVYREIIDLICTSFNISFINNDSSIDLYMIAYHLYDLLVSGFAKNVTTFFGSFIYQNKDYLYDAMDLQRFKKEKTSSSVYIKKAYNDVKFATIISKIKEVIYFISGMDIDLGTYLTYCYPYEKVEFFTSLIAPNGNLFKDSFCITETPELLTEVRLFLQQLITNDINREEVSK